MRRVGGLRVNASGDSVGWTVCISSLYCVLHAESILSLS